MLHNGVDYQDWSKAWEESVAAVLREQSAIQAEITENLQVGDLAGAASACFEHVLTSFELGDKTEAQSYMLLGVAFSNMEFVVGWLEDEPGTKRFKLPGCLEQGLVESDDSADNMTLDQRVAKSAIEAEAVLNIGGHEPDPQEVNIAIRNAVAATCILATYKDYESNDRAELVVFARQLTRELIINWDRDSTGIALDALNCLKAFLIAYGCKKIHLVEVS